MRAPRRASLRLPVIAALVAVGACASSAAGQSGAPKAKSIFAVPEIPAASFLDDASLQVTRPGTMQDLASALINGIDRTGHVRQGLALEVAPFLLWGQGIDLKAYRTRPGFLKANLRLSLATQRTAGDTGSTDISVGIRSTWFDDRDFMRDKSFSDSLGRMMIACARRTGPSMPGQPVDTAATNACLRESIETYQAPSWNSSSLVIAAAYGLRLEQSVIAQGRGTGGRAWFSYARGVGTWGQLLSYGAGDYVRGRTRDSTYSAATVGAKALIGSQRVNGFYQNAWQWRSARASSPIDESVGQWSAGIEFSAREGIWISTGFGGAYAEAEAPDRVVVFANLRWGVASTARLSPRVP